MGIKKNKQQHNNEHRHVYRKRRPPQFLNNKVNSPRPQHNTTIEGSRIINIHKLQEYMSELSAHSVRCGGLVVLAGEARDGLASVLSSNCATCGHNISLQTSRKVKGPRGYLRWECNLAAVWGQMVTAVDTQLCRNQ